MDGRAVIALEAVENRLPVGPNLEHVAPGELEVIVVGHRFADVLLEPRCEVRERPGLGIEVDETMLARTSSCTAASPNSS
jgi:hypothetical protein